MIKGSPKKEGSAMVRQVLTFAIIIISILMIRSSVVEPYRIPSGSMIPNLLIGDHIFVNKMAYGFHLPFTDIFIGGQSTPERGDVIVFRYPKDESINYIKRVIGLPGETIEVKDRIVYVNEKPMEQVSTETREHLDSLTREIDRRNLKPFKVKVANDTDVVVLHDMHRSWALHWGPKKIPEGYVFVMGDNRDRSSDSRSWGFVPVQNVKGEALFVWLSLSLGLGDDSEFSFYPSRFFEAVR